MQRRNYMFSSIPGLYFRCRPCQICSMGTLIVTCVDVITEYSSLAKSTECILTVQKKKNSTFGADQRIYLDFFRMLASKMSSDVELLLLLVFVVLNKSMVYVCVDIKKKSTFPHLFIYFYYLIIRNIKNDNSRQSCVKYKHLAFLVNNVLLRVLYLFMHLKIFLFGLYLYLYKGYLIKIIVL